MTINYLKTPYRITDSSVIVENSVIKLNHLIIRDIKNNQAIAEGSVDMINPNIPDIHVDVDANNFMALNTTAKDNSLYYGIAYTTGAFSFNGPTNNMRIDIDAKTEAGTVFNIPLNASETIKDNDFITFVAKDSSITKRKETSFKGLTMNFYLDIDENSTVNIFTDLGKLSGQGAAERLHLEISSLGDFLMYGDYLISKGEFEYIAKNIIDKKFAIIQGGSIRWTGDPKEASINLKAVYAVRASLSNLYSAAGQQPKDARVLAEAVMNLSGPLLKPGITFDLNFPADAYVKDELQSYLSDINNLNQQAISLIVRRNFAAGGSGDPNSKSIQNQGIATIGSAGTEFAFNQLNNILAQSLNLNFVDFNIRSFNDASASLRLLNKRLIITGGLTDQRTTLNDFSVIGGGAMVAHDVEAQYLIKRDGSLTIRGSNRLNTGNFLNPATVNDYVSALGLVYRQEFDTFNELLRIMLGQKRREEREKQQQKPITLPPSALKPEDPPKSGNTP